MMEVVVVMVLVVFGRLVGEYGYTEKKKIQLREEERKLIQS